MSWSEAVSFTDALAKRGIKLVSDGDRFRAEPAGQMTDAEKAEVGRLRSWLLCNAALTALAQKMAAIEPSASGTDAVTRARRLSAEAEADAAANAGDVVRCRKACDKLLATMGAPTP